jgi:hypothetical protein
VKADVLRGDDGGTKRHAVGGELRRKLAHGVELLLLTPLAATPSLFLPAQPWSTTTTLGRPPGSLSLSLSLSRPPPLRIRHGLH